MRPSITRETITDRRQPLLRWSAVFAGAIVAVALWVLLQMLGMGIGMAAIDLNDTGSLRGVGIGTTLWTMFAPLVALFVGGAVAARLASTLDSRTGVMHGFVTWAIASLVGLYSTVAMVSMLTGDPRMPTRGVLSDDVRVHPGLRHAEIQQATDRAGKMLLGGSLSLLLGLGTCIAGSLLVTRRLARAAGVEGGATRRHTTAEVPVVPPPPEPPKDAPHVISRPRDDGPL